MKHTFLVFLLLLSITAAAQQSEIDRLKHKLAIEIQDTTKVYLLADIGFWYSQSNADSGLIYTQRALDLAKKINFEGGILRAEGGLATALMLSGNYPLGLDYAFKTLSLAKKINSPSVAWANSLVSYSYYYLGEYNTCLKYTLESLKLAQPWELPLGWRDLALVYHSLNQPDSAIMYAKKAYEKLTGDSAVGTNIHYILGNAYAGKQIYDSALSLYLYGVTASQNYLLKTNLVDNYNGIADVYKLTNNLDSAVWYSKKAFAEKIEKSYPIGLLKAANMLADVYGLQNKPDSSLKFLRVALAVKDSLFSREKTLAIQNLAFKEQEKQKEIEASELKYKNQLRIYALLGGLVALLLIAGILFRNNRNKQKAYTLLQEQKGETDKQKAKAELALLELKATQGQLIQSEKMASLGELTAGIAHEIQNPLNFVNNFSDVNKDLLAEMNEEIEKGNYNEAKEIANDIAENEQKINHHGKRADAIVKGMLQHSRSSSGVKEPTDINALADEYLRLAYHGLRAKDKTFNADFKTDFDDSIGKIEVVPQDMGRVLLNLYNNAFYAVAEKRKQSNEMYKPEVSVSTKQVDGKVEIVVKDNGNGIPQKVMDKIYQPFFTTKPTGQGTGLGLSMSYDIIKVHDGELKVKTKEGEFAEFIIQLPT